MDVIDLDVVDFRRRAGPATVAKRTSKYTSTGLGDTVTDRGDSGRTLETENRRYLDLVGPTVLLILVGAVTPQIFDTQVQT